MTCVDIDRQWKKTIAAWAMASKHLGIRSELPFDFQVGRSSHKCIAYLPDFGGPKGMLLQAIFPPEFKTDEAFASDATRAGFYYSFINPLAYGEFDLKSFQEALIDWGFFGSRSKRPNWVETRLEPR